MSGAGGGVRPRRPWRRLRAVGSGEGGGGEERRGGGGLGSLLKVRVRAPRQSWLDRAGRGRGRTVPPGGPRGSKCAGWRAREAAEGSGWWSSERRAQILWRVRRACALRRPSRPRGGRRGKRGEEEGGGGARGALRSLLPRSCRRRRPFLFLSPAAARRHFGFALRRGRRSLSRLRTASSVSSA